VLDVDIRHGGDEELMRLVGEHGKFPPGPAVQTGGGGWHYYFKHPGGRVPSRTIAPGLDIKGDGGQVVAPPSVHYTGVSYEWCEGCGPEASRPDMPDWLLLMAQASEFTERAPAVVGSVVEGARHETMNSLAGTMRRRGFGEGSIFAALMNENEERFQPPLERADVAQIAASYARYPAEEGIIYSSGIANPKEAQKPGGGDVQARTISLRELQHKVFPPRKWAVSGVLPVGLALLAGRLKLGKSWLMLGVGIAIAEGGIALGDIPVDDGDVLYIAYEDDEQRIQGRTLILLGDGVEWPERMEVAETGCWPKRDSGGLAAIDAWLGSHPNARLVVIDTLQRFRGGSMGEGDRNAYAADYAVSAELQELAMRHDVVIVPIHHYRKSISDVDWVDQISGTNGIAGAADTIMGFERVRGEKDAVLKITGRDIVEEMEYALIFEAAKYGWIIHGKAEDVRLGKELAEADKAMLEVGRGQPVHYKALAEHVGKQRTTTLNLLRRLSDKGLVDSLGAGMYRRLGGIGVTSVTGGVPTPISDSKRASEPVTSSNVTGRDNVTAPDPLSHVSHVVTSGNVTDFESKNGVVTPVTSKTEKRLTAAQVQAMKPVAPCGGCGEQRWTLRVGNRWLCEVCQPAVTS
jgi:hypothetical protein